MLVLKRKFFTDKSTIGELWHDDKFICFTLEDKVRENGVKIMHETAIPAGDYEIIITPSTRFKKDMPLIYNTIGHTVSDGVNTWEGIRIHSGNTEANTEGCVLVGSAHTTDFIYNSRSTFNNVVFPLIQSLDKPIKLTIINELPVT